MTIALMRDYASYPNAVIDTSNCHKSWIEMAQVMRHMGVKNFMFHLTLLQPELKGVDPHDPNLTLEQKAMIVAECKENLWYFARCVARIPTKGVKNGLQVRLNRMTLCVWWCCVMNIDVAAVAPRQQGKSVGFDVDTLRTIQIAGENQDVILLTKDAQLRKNNIIRLKAMRDMLPGYLNFTTGYDSDNNEELTVKALSNRLVTAVAQKSKELADNLGRGLTAALLRLDEAAYMFNLHISFPVAAAAGTQARTSARENGTAYGTGLATTPGRRDTDHGKFAYNLITGGFFWNEAIVDSDSRQDAVETILANCSGDRAILNGTFSHRQLGRSDSWLKDAMLTAGGSRESRLKDFLNHWPSGSETSPIDPAILTAIKSSEVEPDHRDKGRKRFIMNWYIKKDMIEKTLDDEYTIMAIDSSNAVGRDANGMVITSIRTMETLGTSNITSASLIEYGLWVAEVLIRFPKMLLVIENKSSGQALMDIIADRLLEAGMNPFKRIFNRIANDPERYDKEWVDIKQPRSDSSMYVFHKGLFGFMTTGRLRAFLYDTVLTSSVTSTGHLVKDKMLIDQLAGLVEKKGRIDHQDGGHDDLVIAWLLANYVARFGKNLWYYGIPRHLILESVSDEGTLMSKEELKNQQHDDRLRRFVESLNLKIESSKSPFEKRMLENKIKLIKQKFITKMEEQNIDNLTENTGTKEKKSLYKAMEKNRNRLPWMT